MQKLKNTTYNYIHIIVFLYVVTLYYYYQVLQVRWDGHVFIYFFYLKCCKARRVLSPLFYNYGVCEVN